ncbi:cation-transporting P-type ATPase [Magnetospirillum sp. SS-4]|uniref:cation-transporting P-type ATPase n=1 Tax=Magnetospirillum sp. SS-4 TaxID=2681465 RepID=UPI00137DE0A2|nr:cation-transporting P-type ATPase [Magnetospirillum sp. SS-4]CAA7620773.1 putative cation-transporting ATPase F [Magnetospirillum sp. SS-4]
MTDAPARAWHAMTADDVLAAAASHHTGLSREEAERRRHSDGPNSLPEPRRRGPVMMLLAQFHNVLIYVLLVSGVGTALIGHAVDAAVIFAVVMLNALIGFIQEGKAERALDAIRRMLTPTAMVMRDGHKHEIPAQDLVVGDVVMLQSGDKVSADLRIIHARSLLIQEAVLTGESLPCEKSSHPVAAEAALAERSCMAYSGTGVVAGHAAGVVVAIGSATEIGRISLMLAEVPRLTTPLLRKMATFGRQLTAAILVLAAATFAFGILVHGFSADSMFLAAVGLAVAAIPEGLPAIVTITLAIGVRRMAARNAIVRRLPAVETLGAVTVICSDKTGTLTRNEMTVRSIATGGGTFHVEGEGYAPLGGFCRDGARLDPALMPDLVEIGRAATLCNDAELSEADGEWTVAGDPMEGALLTLAGKAALDCALERERFPRVDAIPFESGHRFMASLHHDHAGHHFILVKGAPEAVLSMCARQRRNGEDEALDPPGWHKAAERMVATGERLLAIAIRPAGADLRELSFGDVEAGFTLLGLVGLIDPPRDEAITAVRRCRAAGIAVKMITGDHPGTATAIGRQMGMGTVRVMVGTDLDGLDDAALRRAADESDVFARTAPEHKLRLVLALQDNGHVVAMTGDGVNDAPALKQADVGVAMGRKGTEAAKEAAEIVLADDNFASITRAVEEGRTVYDNIRKAIAFILPTNGGEALVMICAIVMGIALPITAKQILWVNMITAVTLALALAFEPPEDDVMRRSPRPPAEPLLSGFLIWRIVLVSVLLVVAVMGLYLWDIAQDADIAAARTVAVNTLVMGEVVYLLNVRRMNSPAVTRRGLSVSRPAIIAIVMVLAWQMLFTYAPPMQAVFDSAALGWAAWGRILAAATVLFVVIEVEKAIMSKRKARDEA